MLGRLSTAQPLISANLLSPTRPLQRSGMTDRRKNIMTLTSPPMGPGGPRGPCCPGGPWWERERLSAVHISLDFLSLVFLQSAPFSVSEGCFSLHVWRGRDRLLRAGWFPFRVLCLGFNENHPTSSFYCYSQWILDSWGDPFTAVRGGTRAIYQTAQNSMLAEVRRCTWSLPRC